MCLVVSTWSNALAHCHVLKHGKRERAREARGRALVRPHIYKRQQHAAARRPCKHAHKYPPLPSQAPFFLRYCFFPSPKSYLENKHDSRDAIGGHCHAYRNRTHHCDEHSVGEEPCEQLLPPRAPSLNCAQKDMSCREATATTQLAHESQRKSFRRSKFDAGSRLKTPQDARSERVAKHGGSGGWDRGGWEGAGHYREGGCSELRGMCTCMPICCSKKADAQGRENMNE